MASGSDLESIQTPLQSLHLIPIGTLTEECKPCLLFGTQRLAICWQVEDEQQCIVDIPISKIVFFCPTLYEPFLLKVAFASGFSLGHHFMKDHGQDDQTQELKSFVAIAKITHLRSADRSYWVGRSMGYTLENVDYTQRSHPFLNTFSIEECAELSNITKEQLRNSSILPSSSSTAHNEVLVQVHQAELILQRQQQVDDNQSEIARLRTLHMVELSVLKGQVETTMQQYEASLAGKLAEQEVRLKREFGQREAQYSEETIEAEVARRVAAKEEEVVKKIKDLFFPT